MANTPDPNPVSLSLPWAGDLILTNNGSVTFCSGVEKLRQRIIRRFFTVPEENIQGVGYVPPDYIFDANYGIGAKRLVGQKTNNALAAVLKSKINAAVLVDEGVDTTQLPVVKLFASSSGQIWASVEVALLDATRVYINFPAH